MNDKRTDGMTIAVLALQGAFAEHEGMLTELGVRTVQLRQKKDLEQAFNGLVLPGGESTVQTKLLKELDMYDVLREKILSGLPVLGTCAGMILLADAFRTFPAAVKRNAYGRQLGSFQCEASVKGVGNFPLTFIRAPYFTELGKDVEVLAQVKNHIVGARYKKQIALAFHPEVTGNTEIHQYFLRLCKT